MLYPIQNTFIVKEEKDEDFKFVYRGKHIGAYNFNFNDLAFWTMQPQIEPSHYTIDWGDGTKTKIDIPTSANFWSDEIQDLFKHVYPYYSDWVVSIKDYKSGWFGIEGGSVKRKPKEHEIGGLIEILSPMPYNPRRESVFSIFGGNNSLSKIPKGLFQNIPNIVNFNSAFIECESLSHVPEDLFSYAENARFFDTVFYSFNRSENPPFQIFSGGLKEIPEKLFSKNIKAENFMGTFESTAIENIPAGLFSNIGTNGINFANTFIRCRDLTSIPHTIFDGITISSVSMCFLLDTPPGLVTGNLPDLWNRIPPIMLHGGCYRNRTAAANWEQVPLTWR